MEPPRNWLAANLDGNMLTTWSMSNVTAEAAQSLYLPEVSTPELIAALRGCLPAKGAPVVLAGSALAPPQQLPFKIAELRVKPIGPDQNRIHALPGLVQRNPDGVMRGAVTRLAGFLALNPDWDGVVCLPGAVTHWVQVSAQEAVSFQSAMTLQLVLAAAQVSGLASRSETTSGWDRAALADAVADGLAKPEMLAARLGSVQAATALGTQADEVARGRIWGLLLGAELAAARPYWLGQNLALIADNALQAPYAAALEAQGLPITLADPTRMTLEGLKRACPWETMS